MPSRLLSRAGPVGHRQPSGSVPGGQHGRRGVVSPSWPRSFPSTCQTTSSAPRAKKLHVKTCQCAVLVSPCVQTEALGPFSSVAVAEQNDGQGQETDRAAWQRTRPGRLAGTASRAVWVFVPELARVRTWCSLCRSVKDARLKGYGLCDSSHRTPKKRQNCGDDTEIGGCQRSVGREG